MLRYLRSYGTVLRSEKTKILLTYGHVSDLRRSLSNESGVVFQCTGHRRSSAMLNPWDVDDLVCKDHPLEPQTSLTPFGVLHLCK